MKLTVANDFQNNLDHITTNSILSHLTGTLNGTETRKENNTAYPGRIPSKSSKVLKKFGTLLCIMTIMNIQTQ